MARLHVFIVTWSVLVFFTVSGCPVWHVGIARAQDAKETRMVLGLPELIDRAIAVSPDMGAIRSEIDAARQDLQQVEAAYYPQLESTALIGPVPDARQPEVQYGHITDPSPALRASAIGVFGRLDVTITQPLYTFGKLSHRREAANRALRATEYALDEKKAGIALRVRELYYALVLARAGLEAAQEADGFFEEAGRNVRRLLELGSPNVREGDVYLIEVYRADTIRSKAEAEKGARVSYFALRSLIGLPPGQEFDPVDRTLAPLRTDPDKVEKYIREAKANRPEFKQLDEALAARQSLVEAARSDRYPSFFAALEGSLAGAPGRDSLSNPYIPDEFNHADAGIVGGLKWNFDFGIGKAQIGKAVAEYDQLRHSRASADMNIPVEVMSIYQELLEWRQAAISYEQAARAARKWVFSAMADFGMGVGTAEEMLKAIEKYSHNQGKYIEALYRCHLSVAELEKAAGMKTW